MKKPLDYFIICKRCGHGARLYHNPGGGCVKQCAGAPAKMFVGSTNSNAFYGWVISKCENKKCKSFAKQVPLSEDEFKSLTPPCPECKQNMQAYRDHYGKGNYRFGCENNDCPMYEKNILFAELLPNMAD